MFALDEGDLERRILGAGDGPASFNAELHRRGGRVVSVDPIYQFSASAIRSRVQRVYPGLIAQVAQRSGSYQWTTFKNPSHLGSIRMSAMNAFLNDFDAGREAGRYIDASLPSLPFYDDDFDLALCSHLLFVYSEQIGVDQHIAALLELSRVAREVRVYPLLAENGRVSNHLPVAMRALADVGVKAEMTKVPYQFQKGATEMLRLLK